MDRLEPIPTMGELSSQCWGGDNVKPRYVDNGIECDKYSYWGGNTKKGPDGKYHLFVAVWDSIKQGHMYWGYSDVARAVADHPMGPYKIAEILGKGHNPEIFQLKDGRWAVYVCMNAKKKGDDARYYISDNITGPWELKKFNFDLRGLCYAEPDAKKPAQNLSNLTFAQREDGSYFMVNRWGRPWFSKDGIDTYHLVSNQGMYPPLKGAFEDPLIWKDHVQYHLIINDWKGRMAYYQRSKDGVNWKVDPGKAYVPDVAKYADGTNVDWYKYERPRVFQDEYGRPTQMHFAVIDHVKKEDMPNDIHSSKQIIIPLTVGRLLTVLNKDTVTPDTKEIRVKITAEKGLNPHTDIDLHSLRFGAPEEVDFGRGCTVISSEQSGADLIVTFNGTGNGFDDDNFAGKLLGKTTGGKLIFGYSRLPWVNYIEPIIATRAPEFKASGGVISGTLVVENFGQVALASGTIKTRIFKGRDLLEETAYELKDIRPFEKTNVPLSFTKVKPGDEYRLEIVFDGNDTPLYNVKVTFPK